MKINQNEIASVELLGVLDGNDIKLVRTKGGLNLAIGSDGKGGETVMGAASHPAILSYNIEKANPGFQSALMKSEKVLAEADKHSHFLSDDLRKSGHDIYSVESGNEIAFYVTKHDLKVGSAQATKVGHKLVFSSFDLTLSPFKSSLAKAVSEKALSAGLRTVKMD